MFKHIFVPTDGSALSESAIRQAVGLAAQTGARLSAFYAKPPYPDARLGTSGFISPVTQDKYQCHEDQLAERFLGYAQTCCEQAGVAFTGLSTVSDMPAEAIIAAARQCEADLICMASHGRRGLRRLLIGSEAFAVLTQTQIPVLILRP